MSTLGNTGTPSQTFSFYGSNVSNNLGIAVTMPSPGGTITDLSAYFAGHGGTITARLCVWDTSGNLLAQTGDISVGAGTGGAGGQSFHSASLTSSYFVPSGTQVVIGFWRHANQSDEWTEQNGGTEYQATQGSNSAPSNVSWSTTGGQPSIYATYTALAAPTISSVSPSPATRGASVTINGSGFAHATSVSIGGTNASFAVINDGQIIATVPGGATAPTSTVTVTNAAGTSGGYSLGMAVTPTISSISPNPATPGGSVTITGTNFTYATTVTIGGSSASFSVTDDSHISATVPNGVTGSVTVTVTDAAGTSAGYTLTVGGVAYVYNGASWVQGVVYINTGTPASPVWTVATLYANTGTPGSPTWTSAT